MIVGRDMGNSQRYKLETKKIITLNKCLMQINNWDDCVLTFRSISVNHLSDGLPFGLQLLFPPL